MAQAIKSDRPVVYVALNYRLGALGFPIGPEAAANKAANLGLRDVLKGLEWIQEHIWAFGGDPNQVTIFGQSAGAQVIALLYLQPEIKLFKAAIMQSAGASTIPIGATETVWRERYDAFVGYAGCNISAPGSATGNDTLGGNFANAFECLKSLPADRILAAQTKAQSLGSP